MPFAAGLQICDFFDPDDDLLRAILDACKIKDAVPVEQGGSPHLGIKKEPLGLVVKNHYTTRTSEVKQIEHRDTGWPEIAVNGCYGAASGSYLRLSRLVNVHIGPGRPKKMDWTPAVPRTKVRYLEASPTRDPLLKAC